MGNQPGGGGGAGGGGGGGDAGGPSSFRSSGKGKDVEEHIARSWRYKNEVKKLYMTEDEIKKKAAEEAPLYCREDRVTQQIQGLLGDEETCVIKIYLTAPIARQKLTLPNQIGVRVLNTFGLIHMGLQVGRMRMDWMSDSLVHMRRMKSAADDDDSKNKSISAAYARIVFDPRPERVFVPNDASTRQKMAEVISLWNRTHTYGMVTGNCQDFVYAVLDAFDIRMEKPGGAFARYLEVLRLHPEKANTRFLPREFRTEFFDTHEQLEEFHQNCRKQENSPAPLDPALPQRYYLDPQEELLLKSFHRAFQFSEPVSKHGSCMFKEPTVYQAGRGSVKARKP